MSDLKMFGTNPRDYDLKVELAKACYDLAGVYLAQYKPNGEHVAVKKYCLEKASKKESTMVQNEILTIRQFNHPNIQTIYTAFVHGSEMYLVSPLMCFGSCKDTIRNCFNTGFPETFLALIMRDVLSGLEYMHRRGYIHHSIRASHILLNQTKAVLAGFRECVSLVSHGERQNVLHKFAPINAPSLNWLAPEVLEQNLIGYTEKADIYSIGITCCELANGIEPFADSQPTFMFTEKIRGNVPTLLDQSTCPQTEQMIELTTNSSINPESSAMAEQAQQIYSQRVFSDEFHQFTEICLDKRSVNRWTAKQLLGHPFFKQCKHSSILDQLQRFSMKISDYDQLRDNSLELSSDMAELSVHGNDWDWDF